MIRKNRETRCRTGPAKKSTSRHDIVHTPKPRSDKQLQSLSKTFLYPLQEYPPAIPSSGGPDWLLPYDFQQRLENVLTKPTCSLHYHKNDVILHCHHQKYFTTKLSYTSPFYTPSLFPLVPKTTICPPCGNELIVLSFPHILDTIISINRICKIPIPVDSNITIRSAGGGPDWLLPYDFQRHLKTVLTKPTCSLHYHKNDVILHCHNTNQFRTKLSHSDRYYTSTLFPLSPKTSKCPTCAHELIVLNFPQIRDTIISIKQIYNIPIPITYDFPLNLPTLTENINTTPPTSPSCIKSSPNISPSEKSPSRKNFGQHLKTHSTSQTSDNIECTNTLSYAKPYKLSTEIISTTLPIILPTQTVLEDITPSITQTTLNLKTTNRISHSTARTSFSTPSVKTTTTSLSPFCTLISRAVSPILSTIPHSLTLSHLKNISLSSSQKLKRVRTFHSKRPGKLKTQTKIETTLQPNMHVYLDAIIDRLIREHRLTRKYNPSDTRITPQIISNSMKQSDSRLTVQNRQNNEDHSTKHCDTSHPHIDRRQINLRQIDKKPTATIKQDDSYSSTKVCDTSKNLHTYGNPPIIHQRKHLTLKLQEVFKHFTTQILHVYTSLTYIEKQHQRHKSSTSMPTPTTAELIVAFQGEIRDANFIFKPG